MRLIGRHDLQDPAGPRFAWSGSAVELAFCSRSIAVRLRGSSDLFQVVLDGKELPTLTATPDRELYPLAQELSGATHHLLLVKRTEPLVGEVQLLGFELGQGGSLLPPPAPPSRRIEFIGDSVTAGFGVRAPDASFPFSPETEDFTISYAALAASDLVAEAVAVAWSGRGVVRNYADEPGDPMPVLYERTLPARPESRWDFARWVPDAVVVNLGTNDFSLESSPPERGFVEAYATLLRRLRAVYAGARVFCCIGPMLLGAQLCDARRLISAAMDSLRGDPALALLEFPPHSQAEGYGASWHPSARTHRRMAAQLSAAIRDALQW
jgi:lysophospholipase L1-like esterase